MTKPEHLIHDSVRECEFCSAPGIYILKVNGFMFNYCHIHLRDCNIDLDEVDEDFSPVENRIQRLMEVFEKWRDER